MKKKYYAVRKGHVPGIFTKWYGSGGAHESINGYSGAEYRGFAHKDDAEKYYNAKEVEGAQAKR